MQSEITSKPSSHLKTSVVICTYNGAKYLGQQLTSILSQDVVADEIIICDDASTDKTRMIIELFANKHESVIRPILNDANIGYTKNFEKATSLATGDIIFFSDQDDVWFNNKIKVACKLFELFPAIAGVTHDGRLVDQNLNWHGTTKKKQIFSGYRGSHQVITGALSAIRRNYLDVFLPFPEGVKGHDTWLTYMFTVLQNRWLHTDLCLQEIRRHSANTSEWVVNSLRPINRLTVLRYQLSTDVAVDYNDRKIMNTSLQKRLSKEASIENLFSGEEVSRASYYLRSELEAINTRQRIANTSARGMRAIDSLSLWAKGGYQYFNGLKSLARDLLR